MAKSQRKRAPQLSSSIAKKLPEYIAGLHEHASTGGNLRSYAAKIKIPSKDLMAWTRLSPRWADAVQIAEDIAYAWYRHERDLASHGQLRNIKKEVIKSTTSFDANGQPVKGKDGKVVIREEVIQREYGGNSFKEISWIYIMRARYGEVDQRPDSSDQGKPEDRETKVFTFAYPQGKLKPFLVKPDPVSQVEGEVVTESVSIEQPKEDALE